MDDPQAAYEAEKADYEERKAEWEAFQEGQAKGYAAAIEDALEVLEKAHKNETRRSLIFRIKRLWAIQALKEPRD